MTVTGIITAIVIGSIIGALGRLVVPGRHPIPIWLTVVIGIVAALVGAAIAGGLGFADTTGVDWVELLVQVVVAAIGVVIAANAYTRRGSNRNPYPTNPARQAPRRPDRAVAPPRPAVEYRAPEVLRSSPETSSPGFVEPSRQTAQARPSRVEPPTPPPAPPSRIFVSYRRSDSRHAARGIAERLRDRFGRAEVFMDVDSLDAGVDFVEGVLEAIRASAVVLVLIGEDWSGARDDRGRRRLDDPTDNVRTEIEHALQWGRPVLPVLLDAAAMPHPDELPAAIKALHRLNGIRVDHVSWDGDVAELVRVVERRRP